VIIKVSIQYHPIICANILLQNSTRHTSAAPVGSRGIFRTGHQLIKARRRWWSCGIVEIINRLGKWWSTHYWKTLKTTEF